MCFGNIFFKNALFVSFVGIFPQIQQPYENVNAFVLQFFYEYTSVGKRWKNHHIYNLFDSKYKSLNGIDFRIVSGLWGDWN